MTVTDPAEAADIYGHVIRLQRRDADGDWEEASTRTHIGQTTPAGRGKTFPELDGHYRALAQVVSLTRPESRWVISATATAVQATDVAPDQGAPPVLRYIEGASPVLRVTAEPPDARGSPLTNGTARLYRDGVLAANLIAQDTTGPLQGWVWDFGPGASETSRVVELDAGYYYATLQWRNANGDSPVSDFSEALTVGADGRSARINTVYRRAAAKPAALASGPDRVPAGTFDDPPDGADPLWLNTGVLDPAAAVYVWNGWMSGATPLDPPTVAISVAGDDVRVVVTDPADADDILGHVIRLQREEPDGDWLDVFTRTHIGQTTAAGRGKTFPELDGTYRALAQVVSLTRAESKWVTSAEVTAVQATDVAPDQGAPPVLRYIEGASPVLRVTAEPPDARAAVR